MESEDNAGRATGAEGSRSVCVVTNGCHECYLDAALLERHFQNGRGLRVERDLAAADVVLLLGCAVMQSKEDETRELIRLLRRQMKPGGQLVVGGCFAVVRPDLVGADGAAWRDEIEPLLRLTQRPDAETANQPYRPYRRHELWLEQARSRMRAGLVRGAISPNGGWLGWLARAVSRCAMPLVGAYKDFIERRIDVWSDNSWAIKVSTGCRGACSYCSIKRSRGDVRSKPIQEVLGEFRKGLDRGYREFALIGTDLGDYGWDIGTDLGDLLERLLSIPGQYALRLRNVNPRWLIPNAARFAELARTGRIAYMETPLQSGSDRVLAAMNRGYGAAELLRGVREIRRACPSIFLKTQIIVGFPGESDEDFGLTCSACAEGLFDYVDVFGYTPRPGTRACLLADRASAATTARRYRKLEVRCLLRMAPACLWKRRRQRRHAARTVSPSD